MKRHPDRPFLAIYVLWHPDFAEGAVIADSLVRHFQHEAFDGVTLGNGLIVLNRSAPAPGLQRPLPVDWDLAAVTVVVGFTEDKLLNDKVWKDFLAEVAQGSQEEPRARRVIPVATVRSGIEAMPGIQALRWNRWEDSDADRQNRLTRDLTIEFSLMLNRYLESSEQSGVQGESKRVRIFLSHSKHDPYGEGIAKQIRGWLRETTIISSFFDIQDIPPGESIGEFLTIQIESCAVVAIHTDSYSSREWCRREVIHAKRRQVPMVVADCISDADQRGFPYMGNVPIIRLDPSRMDRIEKVIGRLLDVTLRHTLWRCQVAAVESNDSEEIFLANAPELISLAGLTPRPAPGETVIVYPDPALPAEEEALFQDIAPGVRLKCLSQWQAEKIP